MIYTVTSLTFLALALAVCIGFNHPAKKEDNCFSKRAHIVFCVCIFIVGCIVRLTEFASLPSGPSADEALVAVQGKSLWQTGHFLGINCLTTQFQMWEGESTGPFLALITAPFVGLFGINAWTARLPLIILSIIAMIAMYGVGKELGGVRAARYALLVEALCPYFILGTRLTISANAALYLLPIAFYAILRGMKNAIWMYPAMIITALLAYTQDLYFFITPFLLLTVIIIGLMRGTSVLHTLLSGIIGFIIVFPATLTGIINLTGGDSCTLFGFIEIPKLISFDKYDWLGNRMKGNPFAYYVLKAQVWGALVTGALFQHVAHENISYMLIEPDGFYALFSVSFPLMLLGFISLICRSDSRKPKSVESRNIKIPIIGGLITGTMIVLFGSIGRANLSGTTYCYDYSSLFFYDALLMVAGLVRLDRKSRIGTFSILSMIGVNFVLLCIFLFGGEYRYNCNVNFPDFEKASIEAKKIQDKSGNEIYVTNEIFPHRSPDEAAECMYLYSINADMCNREKKYSIIYPPVFDQPEEGKIHIVLIKNTSSWDLDAFDYQEFGKYALIIPTDDTGKYSN